MAAPRKSRKRDIAPTPAPVVVSYGGGVQSNALLVMAARGELVCDAFLFCNVGDDSENPDTLRYVRDVAMPYAETHGIRLIELQRVRRSGPATLYQELTAPASRSIRIPVRMSNGAPGNRGCTADWKIRVVARWCWANGARASKPATVMLGISLDEWQRVNESRIGYVRNAYPLVDRRLSRQDCMNLITRAGLPIPPKSSCWFCPMRKLSAWREMHDRQPDQFARAAELEQTINERRARLGKDNVWLSRALKPLPMAMGDATQPALFDEDPCESGYCMV